MDSLTQIVLGASVGEAVLGKKIGNRAMLWGAIAGTIPDLDVLLKFFVDPNTATEMHRGFSHSILFSLLMAPLLGWIAYKIHAKREPLQKEWNWLFFWSLVTHPLLDCNTTWGTQLFWPFDYRVALKNIFVIDPFYTLPFLVLVIIAMFFNRQNPKRTIINRWALIISSSYLALTFVAKAIAHSYFTEALDKQKIAYTEIDTQPTPFNIILWSAQIETKTGFFSATYSFLDSKPITFPSETPKKHQLLAPYENNEKIKQIQKIAGRWYFVDKTDTSLLFTDIRFGPMGFKNDAPYMWKYEITKKSDGKLNVERINFTPDQMNFQQLFSELLIRIKGN